MIGVIGLGNPLNKDDGIGILLIQKLQEKDLPPEVNLFDAGTSGTKILHILKDLERAILVDAVHLGKNPGEFLFFRPHEVKSLRKSKGTHDTDIMEVLKISDRLEEKPAEILIMGIQPADTSIGEELSPDLEKKLPELVENLYEEIKEFKRTR